MIHGMVIGLQARMSVLVFSEGNSYVEIEFVVDTGFEGFLTLPPNIVAELGLPYIAKIQANLADNSKIATNAYAIRILWNGVERDVVVLAMGRRPLIGTALLEDYHLSIDFCEGGTVLVDEIL
ncbi:clan AA aspartic protease [Scytonema hofmannii PCC 7110]|uniref:Clan AA aspartic protease n=2 Tax=Scytonema hofmannii TaxID=34078 RepID=A0A139X3M9_9CYAN|nr:clan AA aspartic protease [Scytonema hofmannii PCC 7110]